MLTKYDELMCHQIVATFDHVDTSARHWTERVILHTHDDSGKLHMSNGFGLYTYIPVARWIFVSIITSFTLPSSRPLSV